MILFFSLLAMLNSFNPNINIENAWVRPAGKGMNSALYFTINNQTNKSDELYKVEASIAWVIQLHKTINNNGLMEMKQINSIEVPANQIVKFTPGGYHVMLIKLKEELKPGSKINFTFFFKKAGKLNVSAEVKKQ
jgi:copper(I)-binding protein